MDLILIDGAERARQIAPARGRDRVTAAIPDDPFALAALGLDAPYDGRFEVRAEAEEAVKKLKRAARSADRILLLTGPDRAGEGLAWWLAQHLGGPRGGGRFQRVEPWALDRSSLDLMRDTDPVRPLDRNKVAAWHSEQAVDHLLRAVVDANWKHEVAAPLESLTLPVLAALAELDGAKGAPVAWNLVLTVQHSGQSLRLRMDGVAPLVSAEQGAIWVEMLLSDAVRWRVTRVDPIVRTLPTPDPCNLSALMQAAFDKLGMEPHKTAAAALRLYEAGLVTYPNCAAVDLNPIHREADGLLAGMAFGPRLPQGGGVWDWKPDDRGVLPTAGAIRPLDLAAACEGLDAGDRDLYDLIWSGYLAALLPPAKLRIHRLRVAPEPNPDIAWPPELRDLSFHGELEEVIDSGWRAVLPQLALSPVPVTGQFLSPLSLSAEPIQSARPGLPVDYLLSQLDAGAITRPHTLGPTFDHLLTSGLLERRMGRLVLSATGSRVLRLVRRHLPEFAEPDWIADLQAQIDRVEAGTLSRVDVLSGVLRRMAPALEGVEVRPGRVLPLGSFHLPYADEKGA